jgi:hypothetical protein
VSDPTAEAERVAQALRGVGYGVVDVPLSMLVARVAVQHPRVILVDADSDGALDVVGRMRELPEADDIHVLYLARPGGAIATPEEAVAHEASGLFVRPVDVPSLVRKVELLTGRAPEGPRSSHPPSLPPASMRSPSTASSEAKPSSTEPAPARPSRLPSDPPAGAGGLSARRGFGMAPPVSAELQELLSEAERRVQVRADSDSMVPSPEEEIEAVLPAELLATLDEPLDDVDDDEDLRAPSRLSGGAHAPHERTGEGALSRTTGASTTGSGATPSRTGRPPRVVTGEEPLTDPPGPIGQTPVSTHGGPTGPGTSDVGASLLAQDETALKPSTVADAVPTVVGPGEAMRVVARAIASRMTGTLRLTSMEAERRVVLREGDVVTAASNSEEESLLAFLGTRGELPRETVRRLGSKFALSGRHAGAALVARGYLSQDQMWPTLRAHAEWVLTRVFQTTGARVAVESTATGRLAGEPSVFGGSTGAEVFVDLVRRLVPPADALERLGGAGARMTEGPVPALLGECALGPAELEPVAAAPGRVLREVLEGALDGDLPTVIFALVLLGVLEALRGVGEDADVEDSSAPDVAALDAGAIRERVRARLQLVEDGDYFAVLGVVREATGYEIRRAFLELRRAFEPSRVLTPEVVDLANDVRTIVLVLEEAYEILKDAARRERYRRAIETAPDDGTASGASV